MVTWDLKRFSPIFSDNKPSPSSIDNSYISCVTDNWFVFSSNELEDSLWMLKSLSFKACKFYGEIGMLKVNDEPNPCWEITLIDPPI